MVAFNISKKENIEGLSPMIIKQRLLYSPDCFVYSDDKGNAQPGIFDAEKLTQKRLLSCMSNIKEGVRLEIVSGENKKIFEFNQQVLNDKNLCQFKKTMSCSKDVAYVMIKDKKQTTPAYISLLVMDYKKQG